MWSGLDSDVEPVASFMKARFDLPEELQESASCPIPFLGQDKIDQLTAVLAEANPGYEETVLAFAAITPRKIAHKHDWTHQMGYAMSLPELTKLRDAAQFLRLQVMLAPRNRELLIRNNRAMIALRDCAFHGESMLCLLFGGLIEKLRLSTLCVTIPHMAHPADEWEKLLGDDPDFSRLVINQLGHELVLFENCTDYLLDNKWKPHEKKEDLFFLGDDVDQFLWPRDYLTYVCEIDNGIALDHTRKTIMLLLETPPDLAKIWETDKDTTRLAYSRVAMLSMLMLSGSSKSIWKILATHDLRHMARLSRLAFEYRAKTGAFPEDLTALSKDRLDFFHHAPLLVETDHTIPTPPSPSVAMYGAPSDALFDGLDEDGSDGWESDENTGRDSDENGGNVASGENEKNADAGAEAERNSFRYFRISAEDPAVTDAHGFPFALGLEIMIPYSVVE